MSIDNKTKLNGIDPSADAISFSQELASKTKVGIITINNDDIDL